MKQFKRITLCGSTRFKKAYLEWNARLTLEEGALVYSVAMWSHNVRIEPTEGQKVLLDAIHKGKIDASDEIFVLDVGGYVGESTKSEVLHAKQAGKNVRFLSIEYPDWTEADCIYAQQASNPEDLADRISDYLFMDGTKKEARRLVLEVGENLPGAGWGRLPLRDAVLKILKGEK